MSAPSSFDNSQDAQALAMLQRFGLQAFAQSRVWQLSGGEQQMLSIARILRTGANILLLDEITEGLAPVIVHKLSEVVRTLKERGFTIVLVEQNFRFASKLADRNYVIEHGQVVKIVERSELGANEEKLRVLLGV